MPSPTSAAVFRVNGVTISDVATATADISRQLIDVTAIGDTFRSHEYAMLEGSVNIECFFDASHDTVLNGLKNGSTLTAAEVVWASGMSVSGNAKVSNWVLSVAPNGVAMATFTLVFGGNAITIDNT